MAALICIRADTFGDFFTPLTLCILSFLPIGHEVADAEVFLAPLKSRVDVGQSHPLTIPAKFACIGDRQLELSVPPSRLRWRPGEEPSANLNLNGI